MGVHRFGWGEMNIMGGEFVSYNNDEEGNEDEESTNKRE